jgi:hypothetical protein
LSPHRKLKYYMFDWDDNVLHMPTRIYMEKRSGRSWRPVALTTGEFARVRGDAARYRPPGGRWEAAFRDFHDAGARGTRAFLEDTRLAVNRVIRRAGRGAPSYAAFKRALIEGSLFAIITARSHRPSSIRKGVEYFIDRVLTPAEQARMIQNLRGFIVRFEPGAGRTLSDRAVRRRYLDLCRYWGVSSPEFQKEMNIRWSGSESPERAKQLAIRRFVAHVMTLVRGRRSRAAISVGFSDDDRRNVRAAETFLRSELAREFPGVRFVVYDTSAGRGAARKIVIRRRP